SAARVVIRPTGSTNLRHTGQMSIEEIESAVEALSAEELARFRAWFVEYDWAAWDRQIELDANAGKLDDLAEQAREDHRAGRTTPL
ncbi:MAG: hypothetical protein ACREA0_18900, partial [bacterium]